MEKAEEAEERMMEMKLKEERMEEILHSSETAKKISEWQNKLEILRLSEMKSTRKMKRLEEKVR